MSSHPSTPRLRLAVAIVLVACFGLLGLVDGARHPALAAQTAPPINLAVSASHSAPITPGATIEYEIYYENYDEVNAANNTVLTVNLPEGSTFAGSSREDVDFPPSSQTAGPTLTYNLQTVGPWESRAINIRVAMPDILAPGAEVMLTASISASETDAYLEDNTCEDTAEVAAPDLDISMWPSGESDAFAPGRTVTYTLEYYNWGELPAPDVRITDLLPSGIGSVQVLWDQNGTLDEPVAIQPQLLATGERVFNLGDLEAGQGGRIEITGKLDANLFAGRVLRHTASISTPAAEPDYENNRAADEQVVLATKPDLWTRVSSSTDGEVGGWQDYYVEFGNSGPLPASNVSLIVTLPSQIQFNDDDIDPPFTRRLSPNELVWELETLADWSAGEGISLYGIIQATGTAQLSARIEGSGGEANPQDNAAQVSDELVTIHMPTIGGPSEALIGATPTFYGLGRPGASVSLYISNTVKVQGDWIGTVEVNDEGFWEIPTPDGVLTSEGWYWFTASQVYRPCVEDESCEICESDNSCTVLTSDVTGVGNYVDLDLGIDSNSITIDGQRVGGIDQTYEWVTGQPYELGADLKSCPEPYPTPVKPILMARFFNDGGLMTEYSRIQPKSMTDKEGVRSVLFDFGAPVEGSFTLTLEYYCQSGMPDDVGQLAPAKLSDLWHPECWFGGCSDDKPEPPKPPKPGCPGCKPLERPKPKPKPIDPDGYVYDAYSVQNGKAMTQALVTNATVTCMRRDASSGKFIGWDANEYSQINPQVTDVTFPDNVLRLGYYSFFVPPGSYRIEVTAPGYLPYVSPVLQVINTPVTHHVPLQRKHQPLAARTNQVFLPLLTRN